MEASVDCSGVNCNSNKRSRDSEEQIDVAAKRVAVAVATGEEGASTQPEGQKASASCLELQTAPVDDATTVATEPTEPRQQAPIQQHGQALKNKMRPYKCASYSNNDSRSWKNLKRITTIEQYERAPVDAHNYVTISGGISVLPSRKFCDLTGFEAKYTDPATKLHYFESKTFKTIRSLPSDIVSGYLSLRNAKVNLR